MDFRKTGRLWYDKCKKRFERDVRPFVEERAAAFKDKWLTDRIRLGVTGLTRSGKTTFITSLIYHLLRDTTLTVSIDDGFPETGARFPYGENIARLRAPKPEWPEPTADKSEIRLNIKKGKREFVLEIVDYPGEWLLDLPLAERSYAQWSASVRRYLDEIGGEPPAWMRAAKVLEKGGLNDAFQDEIVLEIADKYRLWLHDLKKRGFSRLQPGRFVLPDTAEDLYLFVNFFPWVGENDGGALFEKLEARYEAYKKNKVEPFYANFKNLDRQIVLVDCLSALRGGAAAWRDLRFATDDILRHFSYGRRNRFIARLLNSFKIGGVLFAATKADYVSRDEKRIGALTGVLKACVAEAAYNAFGAEPPEGFVEYRSVASVCAQAIDRSGDERCYYFPDGLHGIELPVMLTPDRLNEFRDKCARFDAKPLPPRPMSANGDPVGLEMYNVINYILGGV